MAHPALGSLLRYLRCLHDQSAAEAMDAELLRRHIAGEGAAFDALLRRHAPLVWGVCRRLLDNEQDAEDAFQAVFLVLLRKAESLRVPQSLAAFLHGVALRIAQKARRTVQRRRCHETLAQAPTPSDPLASVEQRELRALLDEELLRLPEKYRKPLILCYLEGKSYTEAARQLGWRDGTVCGRLARAREMLRQRLSRRGLALSVAALAALAEPTAAPAAMVTAVTKMAALCALGQAAGSSAVSAPVATLAQGALHAMNAAKLKSIAALTVMMGLFAAGAGVAASHFLMTKPPEIETTANPPPDKPSTEKTQRTDLYGDPLPPGALLRLGTGRFRSRDGIGRIAYSPDGKLLAAGGYSGDICLYDAATGRKLRQLQAHTDQFPALAFAADGKSLASADSKTIQLWDLATGKELHRMGITSAKPSDYDLLVVVPLVFSHDGKALAWAAGDHSIHLWDAKTAKELVELSGHQKPIRCLAFSPDDKTLFSASYDRRTRDGTVRVWQAATSKETRKFCLSRLQVPLCFSPDSKTLVLSVQEVLPPNKGAKVLGKGYRLAFLDLEGENTGSNIVAQPGQLKTAICSSDGKWIAAMREVPMTVGNPRSGYHNRVQIWDTATGKQLADFPAYARDTALSMCHLAFSPDGKKLAAAATASALHVWDVARGREDPEMTQTHHNRTCCVAFSPDGRTLATGSADHTIALWDAVTGKQRLCLRGHRGTIASVDFSPDGKLLASASLLPDQTVRLWDLSTGKELRQFSVPDKGMTRSVNTWIAFTANGKIMAAAGTDRKVCLWETATGKELLNREVRGLPAPSKQGTNDWRKGVRDVAFSADGRVLAFTIGRTVHIVDVAAGQRLFPLEQDRDAPLVCLSPDGKTMACEGRGHFFLLVEIASGKVLQKLELPENYGNVKMAFTPDGRTIAGAEWDDGRIFLFDVRTGKELLRVQGAASDVHELAFSPDGNKLASAQNDSTAVVWDVSTARRKLPDRNLSAKDLERSWTDLRDADAVKAHAALWVQVAAPDKAVPFLKQHLHPVPRFAPDRLQRLIADLDADEFARREEASRALAKLGSEAEPALRKALESKPSLEMRRRVEALLNDLACQTEMTPDALRQLRAIQVLEQIGSPEARNILKSLTQGAPAAPATRDAVAALQRLDQRSSVP